MIFMTGQGDTLHGTEDRVNTRLALQWSVREDGCALSC
jgi:hypothetical protein